MEELKEVLTVKDLMLILGISRGKAYELAHSNEFHTVKVGTKILIPKTSLQRWLNGETDE